MPRVSRGLVAVLVLASMAALGAAPSQWDAGTEARNWSKQAERYIHDNLDARRQIATHTPPAEELLGITTRAAADPATVPLTVCATHLDGCAGDPRLEDWAGTHRIQQAVSFTNRHGARLSGHVWMVTATRTRTWPRHRPVVAITTGSIQAPEQAYWWAAQVLAAHGFVVLTFDSQGQGSSSTAGDGWSTTGGVPGEPVVNFVDNTRDALDFVLSTPDRPFRPATAQGASTQRDRVAAGSADAFNPLWSHVDRRRVGLAGHSSGAYAGSYLATVDDRVDALVAWDNLEVRLPRGVDGTGIGQPLLDTDPQVGAEPFTPRVPALGLSVDYGVDSGPDRTFSTGPFLEAPDPSGKLEAFEAYRAADVDVAEIVIRGGTHFEFSYLANPAFTATLRGIDLSAWYTAAWFDRYLWRDQQAQDRLLSDRWRHDPVDARIDPAGGGNLFSRYFPSRISIGNGAGRQVTCEDLRRGCDALRPSAADGAPSTYSLYEDR